MKSILFELLNDHLRDARKDYEYLIENPAIVEDILKKGALKAREQACPMLEKVKDAIGLKSLA